MKKLSLLIMAMAVIAPAAFADGGSFSGTMDFFYAADIKNDAAYRRDERFDLNYSAAVEDTRIKADLRAEEDTLKLNDPTSKFYSADENATVYLREGYISQDINFGGGIDSINFRAGRIIYTWGNADELKPVDILNPQDYTFLLFKPIEERKLGVWSADATVYFTQDIFLEGVTIEEFEPDEVENSRIFNIDSAETAQLNVTNSIQPDMNNLAKPHYALRAGAELFGADVHAIWYDGYDYEPAFMSQLTSNPLLPVASTVYYPEIQMIGLDFQRALFSGISVRGEAGYFIKGKTFALKDTNSPNPADNPFLYSLVTGGNGFVEKHLVDVTAGFDVANLFVEKLYMNAEYNGEIMADHTGDIQQDEAEHTILATIDYPFFDDKITPKLRCLYNINDNAFAAGAEAAFKISAPYSITAGVWIIDGKKNSYYGEFSDNDLMYLEGTATF
jgi:hypothetical protein